MRYNYVMSMECDTIMIFAPGAIEEIRSATSNVDLADCILMIDDENIHISTITDDYRVACGRFMRCLCNHIMYGKMTDIATRIIGDLGRCMTELANPEIAVNGMKTLTLVDKLTSTTIRNLRINRKGLPIEEKKDTERCFMPSFDENMNLTHIPHAPKVSIDVKYTTDPIRREMGVYGINKYNGTTISGIISPLYSYGAIYSHMMAMFQAIITDIVRVYNGECSASIIRQSKINDIDFIEYTVRHAMAVAKEFIDRDMAPNTPEICYEHPIVTDTVVIHNGMITITAEINWKETYE